MSKSYITENIFLNKSSEGKNEWWRYLLTILFVFVFLCIGSVLPMLLKNTIFKDNAPAFFPLLEALTPWAFVLLGLIIGVKLFHKRSYLSYTTINPKIHFGKVFFSFSLFFIITALLALINYFLTPDIFELTFQPGIFIPAFLISLVLIPLQVFAEELFYRGYLMQGLFNIIKRPWFPILITSILFTFSHYILFFDENKTLNIYLPLYYLSFSLVLEIVTVVSNSVEISYGIHLATNFFGLLAVSSPNLIFTSPSVFTTHQKFSEFGMFDLLGWWAITIIVLMIVSKKYKLSTQNKKQ